jgi:hypothetical protein
MMKNKSLEFIFIRDKLKKIANLLSSDEVSCKLEAMFIIGCLHTICNEHIANCCEEEENGGA